MRIIAGEARGRTLVAPPGQKTRPTQDYVRESLFNIIFREVDSARVLDLFAGTGALALECMSRGAEQAVLVDMDRQACEAIRKNIAAVGCSEYCRLISRDYRSAVEMLSQEGQTFSLVFLDPPYRMVDTGAMCQLLANGGLLEKNALLVIEHRRGSQPELTKPFICERMKQYGDTEISFVRYDKADEVLKG